MRLHPMNFMGSERNVQWRGPRANSTWKKRKNRTNNEPRRLLRSWIAGECQAYQPPRLQQLQSQNRLKASKHFSKRFNRAKKARSTCLQAPGAPLNTTSYLMRVKERGGIAFFVNPSPLPALISPLPSSSSSSSYKGLADEAKEEWGVNGYGSMSGLIRLRSTDTTISEEGGADMAQYVSGCADVERCASRRADVERCARGCADVERCASGRDDMDQCAVSVQQLEQKLDHDLSRFVMTYPSNSHQNDGLNLMETRMEDQDSHIANLEEENMTLKERLYVMQQEVGELRRRMLILEHGGFDQTEACSDEKSTADLSK